MGMDLGKIFGGLGGGMTFLIPGILQSLGMSLKNKDDNTTGTDDAAGNVVIALAPVVPAFLTGDEKMVTKTLLAAYNTIGGYLGFEPRSLAK